MKEVQCFDRQLERYLANQSIELTPLKSEDFQGTDLFLKLTEAGKGSHPHKFNCKVDYLTCWIPLMSLLFHTLHLLLCNYYE